MLFDTDVLIWAFRGQTKAADAIDAADGRAVSVVTYMELLQGAQDKKELQSIQRFLSDLRFETLPLTENIGHRASIYLEEYVLSVSMRMADALIAATAVESGQVLLTGNQKRYRSINELQMKTFRP